MYKCFAAVCAAASMAAVVGGCAAGKSVEKQSAPPAAKATENREQIFPEKAETPALALAEKFVGGLVESLKSGDFQTFLSAQPAGSRPFKKEDFDKMRDSLSKRYGKLTASEYLGQLDQGRVRDFLWKFTFERDDSAGIPAARRQIVCWVRVGAVNGEPVLAGFSFCFF